MDKQLKNDGRKEELMQELGAYYPYVSTKVMECALDIVNEVGKTQVDQVELQLENLKNKQALRLLK
ncbi:hypothetical protein [Liquorilactobacillus satsumensis]|uniref:Uncharacterized protein n=1 Tax=Liquorilactobacillus satsumensis DSM 16230 = JCM 12392 TaxID=1423801 RepID=A0A0R1V2D3_9LACO|nr:hypothetical protein [Liquorilactobacillus satsumensis]KRL99756.1 hypothetical protein FD50_GL000076 [Liquorilactobacillus satsumensis DSM 16230 = JCM 12392]